MILFNEEEGGRVLACFRSEDLRQIWKFREMWRLGLADIKTVWIRVGGCHWTIRELGILTVGEGESIKWVFKFLEQIWCLNFKKLLYI